MSMTTENDPKVVIVECTSRSGRFVINETTFVLIKGLHFIGCIGNKVSHVDNLILKNTIFEGMEGNITGLELNMVAASTMTESSFLFNSNIGDGVIVIYGSSFTITNSAISKNAGEFMYAFKSSVSIINITFTNHRQICTTTDSGHLTYIRGEIIVIKDCSVAIANTTFNNNTGQILVLFAPKFWFLLRISSLSVINSTFTNNSGTVIDAHGYLKVNITNSNFINNRNHDVFSALLSFGCRISLNIAGTNFIHNTAPIIIFVCQMIKQYIFYNDGCTILVDDYCPYSYCMNDEKAFATVTQFVISNSVFKENINTLQLFVEYIGIIHILRALFEITNSSYERNMGSFYIIQSTIFFTNVRFESCLINGTTIQERGVITSYQSNIAFIGASNYLLNNTARQGGVVMATESTITITMGFNLPGEVTIANNTATNASGGGIYLQQSRLEIRGKCTISNNRAVRGGGIYASSSSIIIYQSENATLQLINNSAEIAGGGAYLEVNPRLTLMKGLQGEGLAEMLIFSNNHANYGGAVYVADETSSIPCTSNKECLIQLLMLNEPIGLTDKNPINAFFSGNTANAFGSNLFGGLLDRCIQSPFAVWLINVDGFTYLSSISNITLDSIASLPVRICFCNSDNQPDCNYQLSLIQVRKGETFFVSLVAVDQVNHTVDASQHYHLSIIWSWFR